MSSIHMSKRGGARDELGGVSSLVPDLHSGACSIQYMYGQWVYVVTNASVRTISSIVSTCNLGCGKSTGRGVETHPRAKYLSSLACSPMSQG